MGLKRDILIGLGILGIILLGISIIIGLIFLLTKSLGLVLILFGIFLMKYFPDVSDYQSHGMSFTGIVLGVIAFGIGIYLLIFA